MITPTLNTKIADAMKAHDELTVSTLRMLSSEFNYEKIAKQHDLTEEEELGVVRKEVKKRRDAIEIYTKNSDKADVGSRIEREKAELAVLEAFLPKQMDDTELVALVETVISKFPGAGLPQMGAIIKEVVTLSEGRVDGSRVANVVRGKLVG